MHYKYFKRALWCCVTLMPLPMAACTHTECSIDNSTTMLSAYEHQLTVEVVSTRPNRDCGLAFRETLPDNHGMLFVFRDDRILEFWMKNTVIPLTIAYINVDGKILEIHYMDPHESERRYTSSIPARYALETNQGWFRTHGIEVGDKVNFHLPADLKIH
jgi:uncharacterized membrane protein (UPF0127 family)